eukprot:m.144481 g.144481  ORF g.144481 m.144481 type:complete len:97 (-) comp9672_c0_seq3:225-515(-)
MAYTSDTLGSIQKEIQRFEANIDNLQKKIDDNELDKTRSALVKKWKQEREKYEDELEKARQEERKLLPPPAQGEPSSLCWFDDCVCVVNTVWMLSI